MNHSISKYLKTVNIAAHRGSCGGNIPPNTSAAYEAALYQGANITTVQKLLGHRNIGTTQIYSEVMDTTVVRDLERNIH